MSAKGYMGLIKQVQVIGKLMADTAAILPRIYFALRTCPWDKSTDLGSLNLMAKPHLQLENHN